MTVAGCCAFYGAATFKFPWLGSFESRPGVENTILFSYVSLIFVLLPLPAIGAFAC